MSKQPIVNNNSRFGEVTMPALRQLLLKCLLFFQFVVHSQNSHQRMLVIALYGLLSDLPRDPEVLTV